MCQRWKQLSNKSLLQSADVVVVTGIILFYALFSTPWYFKSSFCCEFQHKRLHSCTDHTSPKYLLLLFIHPCGYAFAFRVIINIFWRIHLKTSPLFSFRSTSAISTDEAEQHLTKTLTCLLLCKLIFEVDVDKTTPKCCITSCQQQDNHKQGAAS